MVSPRRAGEILLDMEKAKGVQLNGTDSLGGYRLQPPSMVSALTWETVRVMGRPFRSAPVAYLLGMFNGRAGGCGCRLQPHLKQETVNSPLKAL